MTAASVMPARSRSASAKPAARADARRSAVIGRRTGVSLRHQDRSAGEVVVCEIAERGIGPVERIGRRAHVDSYPCRHREELLTVGPRIRGHAAHLAFLEQI